jgi:hypothetical protein
MPLLLMLTLFSLLLFFDCYSLFHISLFSLTPLSFLLASTLSSSFFRFFFAASSLSLRALHFDDAIDADDSPALPIASLPELAIFFASLFRRRRRRAAAAIYFRCFSFALFVFIIFIIFIIVFHYIF